MNEKIEENISNSLEALNRVLEVDHNLSIPIDSSGVLSVVRQLAYGAHMQAYEERREDFSSIYRILDEARFNYKAARYCAAIQWARHYFPGRLKTISRDEHERADVKCEEWTHMFIDGPDVGVSWEKMELQQDASIKSEGLDSNGELKLELSVGPLTGNVSITKEMWEEIGKSFKND